MNDRFDILQKKVEALEKRLDRQLSFEPSKIVVLPAFARVIDDTNVRTAPYNNNYQVSGITITGGLPTVFMPNASQITGVFWSCFMTSASSTNITLVVISPDVSNVPIRIGGPIAAGGTITGSGFAKLGATTGSFPGQLTVNLAGGTYNRLVLDITGYLV